MVATFLAKQKVCWGAHWLYLIVTFAISGSKIKVDEVSTTFVVRADGVVSGKLIVPFHASYCLGLALS